MTESGAVSCGGGGGGGGVASDAPTDPHSTTTEARTRASEASQAPHAFVFSRPHEVLRDRSEIAFYGLDNSGSMGHTDGNTLLSRTTMTPASDFGEIVTAPCHAVRYQPRWAELVEATKLVALYNVKRGIKAVYMLLNPRRSRDGWVPGVDIVIVDPSESRSEQEAQLRQLFTTLLAHGRVGGSTPLDRLTDEFRRQLAHISEAHSGPNGDAHVVSYTLFTDGVPDSKQRFEASLRFLAGECRLGSVTINLTTDDDGVVSYFNSLDTRLGAATSSLEGTRFDVIDDLAAEAKEVASAGNRFLNYCLPIHVARMAGCNNPVADELDERVLPRHYVSKLCKEVASLPDDTPHFTDLDGFLTVLRSRIECMPSYWNPRSRRSEPILKINRVKAYLMPRTAWWVPVGTTPRECKTFLILAALAIILFAFMVSSSSTSHVPRRYGPR